MGLKGRWESTGFGAALRAHRRASGLSAKALAERSGLSPTTVLRYEAGHCEPAWPAVLDLARALSLSPADFVPGAARPGGPSQ